MTDFAEVKNAPSVVSEADSSWPVLGAPALIGGSVVAAGCSAGIVVEIAQRQHAMMVELDPVASRRRDEAMLIRLQQVKGVTRPIEAEHELELSRDLRDLAGGVQALLSRWDRGGPIDDQIDYLRGLLKQQGKQGS